MFRRFVGLFPALGLSLLCVCCGGAEFEATGAGGTATGGSSGAAAGAAGVPVTGSSPSGNACNAGNECASGYCADGVCCDSACDGPCVACKGLGADGTCTPYANGADPEGDCGQPGEACAGSCDGDGACAFPDSSTSCGADSCADGQQTEHRCDGAGSCSAETTSCGYFACGQVSCASTCTGDADCATDAYCSSGACQEKKDNGGTCTAGNACKSGMCALGFCCNAVCSLPFSCSSGTCKCGDQVCGSQEACITWYADKDGDQYGDPDDTMLGCASTPPASGFVKNDDDCYDKNANAHPGQTAFFPTPRGDNSFDYDCSGNSEPQYPDITGKSCGRCYTPFGSGCVQAGCNGGWGCNGTCPSTGPSAGFLGSVACGQPGMLNTCGDDPNTGTCDPIDQTTSMVQGCR